MKTIINKFVDLLVSKRAGNTHNDLTPTPIRTVGERYDFNETFNHIYKQLK
jgi:hypothetical protein